MAKKRQRGNGQGTLFQREDGGAWIAKWYDHNGRRRERSTRTTDKRAAERIMGKWSTDATLRRENVIDARVESLALQARRPLSEHLADFKMAILAKGATPAHAELVQARARNVIDGADFKRWADISASRAMEYLKDLRVDKEIRNEAGEVVKRKRGISAQTFNFYLQALKQFGRWMVKDRRAADNPFAYLEPVNVKTDRRHDRRALTADELRTLISTTKTGPDRYGMKPEARALLYQLAVETGFRAGELRSLTRASFQLDTDSPTVTVAAAYSKRRREDTQCLRPALAELLKKHLAGKAPATPAFNIPAKRRTYGNMFKADLAAAGIVYRDDAGLVCDLHALRHSFITHLAAGKVHPKTAQVLARHSSITLTMNRYTHTLTGDDAKALSVLPDLSAPVAAEVRILATDGSLATPDSSPTSSSAKSGIPDASRRNDTMKISQATDSGHRVCNAGRNDSLRDSARAGAIQNGEGGIRTRGAGVYPHAGLANRCEHEKSPVNHADSEVPPPVAPPVGGKNKPTDPELARVVDAWAELPPAIRAGILAMVNAANS